jgi:hypothetical protein
MRDVRVELYDWLLAERSHIVDRGRLNLLERHLAHLATAGLPGVVTEFGGHMAAWMRAVLDASGDPEREIGVRATDTEDLFAAHDLWNLRRPTVLTGDALPDRIAFAYLNEKHASWLAYVVPRLVGGAAVVLDGCAEDGTGPVAAACRDIFGPNPPVTVHGRGVGVYRHRVRPDLPAARRAADLLSTVDAEADPGR